MYVAASAQDFKTHSHVSYVHILLRFLNQAWSEYCYTRFEDLKVLGSTGGHEETIKYF